MVICGLESKGSRYDVGAGFIPARTRKQGIFCIKIA
jgi:hypothetical protein